MIVPKLKAGEQVIQHVVDAILAGNPVLLIGRHGVGKSELLEQVARRLRKRQKRFGFIAKDLSLLMPCDLLGIPQIRNGVTYYARPAWLPTKGQGLLVIEELGAAPDFVKVPCLELLTRGSMGDWVAPEGWRFAACTNPAGEKYLVDDLDPALASRFQRFEVIADPVEWCEWARGPGRIHPKVIEFVLNCHGIFESPDSNPRSWTYVSRLLFQWEKDGMKDPQRTREGVASLVGEAWASPFEKFYTQGEMPITPEQIVEQYTAFRPTMKEWFATGRLDVIVVSLEMLKSYLRDEDRFVALLSNESAKERVRQFLFDLPADLKRGVRQWLKQHGRDALKVPRSESKQAA